MKPVVFFLRQIVEIHTDTKFARSIYNLYAVNMEKT
jgi:hypothetical protein